MVGDVGTVYLAVLFKLNVCLRVIYIRYTNSIRYASNRIVVKLNTNASRVSTTIVDNI